MSLWKHIACSSENEQRFKQYYAVKGLAEIRVYLAQWIEERIISERFNSPTSSEQIAQSFCEDLQKKVLNLHNSHDLTQLQLTEICTIIAHTSALELYSYIRNGIQMELQLSEHMPQMSYFPTAQAATPSPVGVNYPNNGVYSNGVGGGGGGGIYAGVNTNGMVNNHCVDTVSLNGVNEYSANLVCNDETTIIYGKLDGLKNKLNSISERIDEHNKKSREFYMQINSITDPNKLHGEEHIQQMFNLVCSTTESLKNELALFLRDYNTMQDQVINLLKTWQRSQAIANNGGPIHDNLNEIQLCLEMLVIIVGELLRDLNLLSSLTTNQIVVELLNEMHAHVSEAQKVLLFSSFIVEKQPPQVMKTNTRFATSVRWLIGPSLGIAQNCPTVECAILSEAQAQRHTAQRTMPEVSASVPPTSGDISNNSAAMEYNQQLRVLSASFRNMQLRKIKRAEKKGTESVMDEKFTLLFYTSTIINNCRIYVWTLSLPVVAIVHGNQEPQSWATITWDNAFSDIVREPFVVPERVTWQQLSYALNMKFASVGGRPLTDENLNFLYEKLFRNDGVNGDHKDYITWSQFCKDNLSDRLFPFWDWFYAIMKLTKEHLLGLWKAGLIVGFINKDKTRESLLSMNRPGEFLLRFSDSESGGISVAFVTDNFEVMNLKPWVSKDLGIRGLADRLHDIEALKYVYPFHKSKDEVFREFYSEPPPDLPKNPNGYVNNLLKAVVPLIEAAGSAAPTPQHQMQSPSRHEVSANQPDMSTNFFGNSDLYEYLHDEAQLDAQPSVLNNMNWDDLECLNEISVELN